MNRNNITNDNLKPFDRIIVRNSQCADTWTASIFSHYEWHGDSVCEKRRYAITIDTAMWDQCLPYDDSLAKYLGTDTDLEGADLNEEEEQ